jgi:hypothetical protein
MPRSRDITGLLLLALGLAVSIYILLGPQAEAGDRRGWRGEEALASDGRSDEDLLEEIRALRAEVARLGQGARVPEFPLPRSMSFAGMRVPLERPEVRQRLDYELLIALGRPAMPLLWIKRSDRVLPAVRRALGEAGLPEDLLYVAVVESDLRSEVSSPAGAMGLWQFMRATGRRYGLRIDRYVDERRHPGRATEAALRYLQDLHGEFGDWFLAMAAYNSGERRVREAVKEQGELDYFSLYLPHETRRYVYRALAAKLILEDPEAYGLVLPPERRLAASPTREETLRVGRSREDLADLARDLGVPYLAFRELNPQLRGSSLPRGSYRVTLPAEEPGPLAPAMVPGVLGTSAH